MVNDDCEKYMKYSENEQVIGDENYVNGKKHGKWLKQYELYNSWVLSNHENMKFH